MSSPSVFPRPTFVPEFVDFTPFRTRTVGITGQRGVLGGILLDKLLEADIDVAAYPGDINDEHELSSWSSAHKFGYFFHFAAVVPVTMVEHDPITAYRTNAIGSFNVCTNVALAHERCWSFLGSSSHVYKPTSQKVGIGENAALAPQSFYGVTKLAGERICEPLLKKMQAEYCIGRIFSFTHRTQPEPYLVPTLQRRVAALKSGDILTVRNPSAVRDIQDASTVIECVLHLASRRASGVINIGTGHGMTVKEIAGTIAKSQGKAIKIEGKDDDAQGCLVADISKLRQVLLEERGAA